MTDQATTEAVPAGTSEGASGTAANNGSQAAPPSDIFAGLQDAESRQWVESKGYHKDAKAADTLVKSARYAEQLQTENADLKSKALTPPAQDAPKEQWDAFYAKLGRPEKAEGFEFSMPKDLPEGLPYDGESATAFKSWAHEAGLSPRQAQTLHDRFVSHQAGAYSKQAEANNQRMTAAHGELQKVWGDKGTDSYKTNLQFADRFISQNGGDALLSEMKSNGLLASDGAVLSPILAQAIAKAGKALYSEGQFVSGNTVGESRPLAQRMYPPEKDPFRRT